MSIKHCYICEQEPVDGRRYGGGGLGSGSECPICYRPTCRYHLTTVRWYWRSTGEVGSALVCKECKRTYQHRHWDTASRDWIT